ncbi:hypothetical protein CDL12_08705 [Handroanthus impetiginosus]|uniref:Uncharacterized protein n=1 Tax=Handroanthus impetiginosus TaxID=429701 RepID=A0A2G9HM70_9LAMI|nr:hypothetical protein CDL12_08705 [Handroanthus impetiginosus]
MGSIWPNDRSIDLHIIHQRIAILGLKQNVETEYGKEVEETRSVNQAGVRRLRHPRKDKNSTSSQARRRRKLSGGHCECL